MSIVTFLKERRSWIVAFIFLQFFLLFVAWIDPTINVTSALYAISLALFLFCLFLIYRFYRETAFFKKIEALDHENQLSQFHFARSPFEKQWLHYLGEQMTFIRKQTLEQQALLDRESDELVAWIHEVKTPMTALRLMIEQLDDLQVRTEFLYEWLRIHYLVDQQLHQKRLLFIENDTYIEEGSLHDVLISEIKNVQAWCFQKGIGFDLQGTERSVFSDFKWLSFILRQLLSNSIKYSHDSDIVITGTEENGMVTLTIEDFGRGIDARDLPRIFERGFTSTVHHDDHAATGMGLYLAKKAADSLKIRLHVQSELSKGTTVILHFPKRNQFNMIERETRM
ncbi:histidine kinase, homodimeric [Fictibacillus macauensis ZFHKF-1]|uniref:histidine kinase n=1 Tax=Fictibacillus macauensis ZFHKF-1 TaxID=1196324 RepID=I8UD32_9BACL|nr:sensor histidine kinase [Fictibacillus macauensis]EIT84835.1 histidine kinase, homodimeric [Fictibacillus macauensis ZFHKF-1]